MNEKKNVFENCFFFRNDFLHFLILLCLPLLSQTLSAVRFFCWISKYQYLKLAFFWNNFFIVVAMTYKYFFVLLFESDNLLFFKNFTFTIETTLVLVMFMYFFLFTNVFAKMNVIRISRTSSACKFFFTQWWNTLGQFRFVLCSFKMISKIKFEYLDNNTCATIWHQAYRKIANEG